MTTFLNGTDQETGSRAAGVTIEGVKQPGLDVLKIEWDRLDRDSEQDGYKDAEGGEKKGKTTAWMRYLDVVRENMQLWQRKMQKMG